MSSTVASAEGALYGPQTALALANFPSRGRRLADVPQFVGAYAQVKGAAALANVQLGVLDSTIGHAIAAAAAEVGAGLHDDQFPTALLQGGGGTSTNMNLNEVLAKRASQLLREQGDAFDVHPNDHVNRSQSTNDTYPTAMSLAVGELAAAVTDALRTLETSLLTQAEANNDTARLGRTCLQDAVPLTVGETHRAQARAVARGRAEIDRCVIDLRAVPFGATAIGTSVGAPPGFPAAAVAHLNELAGTTCTVAPDFFDALAHLDPYSALAASVGRVAVTVEKIARDLRLLSSGPVGGLGEVRLPARQAGSSIMPGKINPVIPELVIQLSQRVRGCGHTVDLAVAAGELELNVMEPVILDALVTMFADLSDAATSLAHKCIDAMEWDRAGLARNLAGSLQQLVELASDQGYAKASALAVQPGTPVEAGRDTGTPWAMTGTGTSLTSGSQSSRAEGAPVLGCIADDITGATDVASALTDAGLRTTLVFGVPDAATSPDERCDAVVVALKSRTLPVRQAVEQSVAALKWLRRGGVTRFYLKYCSTFDSTEEGNIGPVADAAMQLAGSRLIAHAPAYPDNGRTVYQGHLFVGRALLSESGMEHHPLTPMTDPNLVRFLAHQTSAEVALLPLDVIRGEGATSAIRDVLRARSPAQPTHIIVDSITNTDLDAVAIAVAAHGSPLMAGGAAFGAAWGRALGTGDGQPSPFPVPDLEAGPAAVLAGSASSATRRQVAAFEAVHPTRRLTADGMDDPDHLADELIAWGAGLMSDQPVLIAADTTPAGIEAARERFGHAAASARIERVLGLVAVGLVAAGLRRLVVAGGETSGAVAEALGIRRVRIGPSICPGVPWTASSDPDIAIAFKSGNFGGDDFFADALQRTTRPDPSEDS